MAGLSQQLAEDSAAAAHDRQRSAKALAQAEQRCEELETERDAARAANTARVATLESETVRARSDVEEATAALDAATTNPHTGESLYRRARDAFSKPSELVDAAKAGRLAIDRDEASILSTIKGMSDNELQAFRIGAFEGLRGKLKPLDGGEIGKDRGAKRLGGHSELQGHG